MPVGVSDFDTVLISLKYFIYHAIRILFLLFSTQLWAKLNHFSQNDKLNLNTEPIYLFLLNWKNMQFENENIFSVFWTFIGFCNVVFDILWFHARATQNNTAKSKVKKSHL